jgi:hypothetical protein
MAFNKEKFHWQSVTVGLNVLKGPNINTHRQHSIYLLVVAKKPDSKAPLSIKVYKA